MIKSDDVGSYHQAICFLSSLEDGEFLQSKQSGIQTSQNLAENIFVGIIHHQPGLTFPICPHSKQAITQSLTVQLILFLINVSVWKWVSEMEEICL